MIERAMTVDEKKKKRKDFSVRNRWHAWLDENFIIPMPLDNEDLFLLPEINFRWHNRIAENLSEDSQV